MEKIVQVGPFTEVTSKTFNSDDGTDWIRLDRIYVTNRSDKTCFYKVIFKVTLKSTTEKKTISLKIKHGSSTSDSSIDLFLPINVEYSEELWYTLNYDKGDGDMFGLYIETNGYNINVLKVEKCVLTNDEAYKQYMED